MLFQALAQSLRFQSALGQSPRPPDRQNKFSGLDGYATDFDGTTEIDHTGADRCILAVPSAAEDGPVLFKNFTGVSMVTIDDRPGVC